MVAVKQGSFQVRHFLSAQVWLNKGSELGANIDIRPTFCDGDSIKHCFTQSKPRHRSKPFTIEAKKVPTGTVFCFVIGN